MTFTFRTRARSLSAALVSTACAVIAVAGAAGATPPPLTTLQADQQAIASGLSNHPAPKSLQQAIPSIVGSLPAGYHNGCHAQGKLWPVVVPTNCVGGNTSSAQSIYLIGDSHAEQWSPGLTLAATTNHWKLTDLTMSGCVPSASTTPSTVNGNLSCQTWNHALLKRIVKDRPKVVVVGTFLRSPEPTSAMVSYLKKIKKVSAVVLLGDTPTPRAATYCAFSHLSRPSACAFHDSQSAARAQLQAIATDAGVGYLPTAQWFCKSGRCPITTSALVLYRDDSHISTETAAALRVLFAKSLVADSTGPGGAALTLSAS